MIRPARIAALEKVMGRTVFVDDLRDRDRPLIALTVTRRVAKDRNGAVRAVTAPSSAPAIWAKASRRSRPLTIDARITAMEAI